MRGYGSGSRCGQAKLLFPLGRIVATPGALALLTSLRIGPSDLLNKHQSGDWGRISLEDSAENAYAINRQLRILSCYLVGHEQRIWIITEADRSITTLLLPEEY